MRGLTDSCCGLAARRRSSFRCQELFLARDSEQSIREFVANGFRYHVAELNGRIVGFVGVRDNKHLYHLFVANEYQRQGLGRRLWSTARTACLAGGRPRSFPIGA